MLCVEPQSVGKGFVIRRNSLRGLVEVAMADGPCTVLVWFRKRRLPAFLWRDGTLVERTAIASCRYFPRSAVHSSSRANLDFDKSAVSKIPACSNPPRCCGPSLCLRSALDAIRLRRVLSVRRQAGRLLFRHNTALLHRSAATRNAPYPRRNSGGAFETWAAKSGHPVENADANPGFCFLIFEGARL